MVEDDPISRAMMRRRLESAGYRVSERRSGREALGASDEEPMAVCLDIGLGDMSGVEVLQELRKSSPELPVVVVTAHGDAETAVQAMHAGAYEYLIKPLQAGSLEHAVGRAVERQLLSSRVRRLKSELDSRQVLGSIIGQSSTMREVATQVERILESDVAVSLFGQSGTGKEVVARAIHAGGRRRHGPFVAINCAAIPESLQESELFGHERGAFTGAAATHKGRFEQASGGTLFLDEIGEMSSSTQAHLLRTLQERTIRRIGGVAEIAVDARIICATHKNLSEEVRCGRFRQDLYFRLVVYPIQLPPLSQRLDDIPLLLTHFLQKLRADVGHDVRRVNAEALDALSRYGWPGNVRELMNVVHRAMLACDGDELTLSHLPPHVREACSPETSDVPRARSIPAKSHPPLLPLRELERRAIEKTLRATGGSVGKAARILGIGRATLYRRLNELELPR